ncbi:NAD(P)-binding protein [Pseudomonas sp. B21-048]|uniref:NAD(P)-binding protein n=1 Tax=Pseudomonas sp. B21-048 TaxID=2895490 RepID=UPI00215F0D29|nr:NAD(P)-binding protein [Pseudomonas sp. B21-048]UVL01059.1 NAD(P)-binding protein [Pseudomonas sp. B21-048]
MNQIIIAGTGITGLTLAFSLHEKGYQVKVYESAKVIGPLGAGLNIQPYAMKVLTELGLLRKLQDKSITVAWKAPA